MLSLTCIVGCTHSSDTLETQSSDETNLYPVVVDGQEFLYTSDESITLYHPEQQERVIIPATKPSDVRWSAERESIFWIEKGAVSEATDSEQYYIYEFSLQDGEQRTVSWSKGQMSELSLSWGSNQLAFIEQEALYVFDLKTEQVHRVAEQVQEYSWSPEKLAIALSTEQETLYVSLNSDSSIGSSTVLFEEQPLHGLVFLDKRTVLGFSSDSPTLLYKSDLLKNTTSELVEWKYFKIKEPDSRTVTTVVSPNQKSIAVHESRSADTGTVTVYNIIASKRQISISQAALLGWEDNNTLLIAKKDSNDTLYSTYTQDIKQGTLTTVLESVPSLPEPLSILP